MHMAKKRLRRLLALVALLIYLRRGRSLMKPGHSS
jgi:hypothetical protein